MLPVLTFGFIARPVSPIYMSRAPAGGAHELLRHPLQLALPPAHSQPGRARGVPSLLLVLHGSAAGWRTQTAHPSNGSSHPCVETAAALSWAIKSAVACHSYDWCVAGLTCVMVRAVTCRRRAWERAQLHTQPLSTKGCIVGKHRVMSMNR